MSTLRYIVEVEIERESGLFASRDELSEIVADALSQATLDADLSGVGANSDSVYNVEHANVVEIDNKQLKAEWKNNEQKLLSELPGDSELRKQVKALRHEVKEKTAEIHRLLGDLERARMERAGEPTRVFASEGYGGDKVYLPDSVLDRVNFIVEEDQYERDIISVTHRGEEGLEVRYENMGRNVLAVLPQSGNVLRLVVVPR